MDIFIKYTTSLFYTIRNCLSIEKSEKKVNKNKIKAKGKEKRSYEQDWNREACFQVHFLDMYDLWHWASNNQTKEENYQNKFFNIDQTETNLLLKKRKETSKYSLLCFIKGHFAIQYTNHSQIYWTPTLHWILRLQGIKKMKITMFKELNV